MGKKRKSADHCANTRGGRWVGIPEVVLLSDAYLALDPFERAVLVELLLRFNGYNNGKIAVSYRELAARLRNSNFKRISQAAARLVEVGLVAIELEGTWAQRKAREYRITFISSGKPPHTRPATEEYRAWKPDRKSGADTASAAATQSAGTSAAATVRAADAVSARIAEHRRKTAKGDVAPC